VLLYDSPVSGNCYKVRLLFAHLGTEYERRELDVVDHRERPEILGGLNPALRVPTVVLDDGRALAESNALLVYFGEGTAYLPDDRFERAQVLQWMFFEQNLHEPNVAVARYWVSIAANPPDEPFIEQRRKGGHAALKIMERHLAANDFLAAGRFTIADIALYGYTHCAPEGGIELDGYPAIGAWLERVKQLPGHVPMDA
jgi:glutathione S-transferase